VDQSLPVSTLEGPPVGAPGSPSARSILPTSSTRMQSYWQGQLPRPYHGKVFLLQELDEVVARYGLPTDDDTSYFGYQSPPFEKYIEVQVSSDQSVGACLALPSEIESRSDRSRTE
jgi:hypothetical protein